MFEIKTVRAAGEPSRGIKRVLAASLLAVVGTVAVSAWAQAPEGGGHPPMHGMHRAHGGGFMGPGLFMGSPEHVGRAVDRMLDGLNATDAQRSQIKQIALAAAADLKAQHDANRGQHEQGLALFTAPVIDARAVEALRQQRLAQHDQASKRVSQALIDVANVLTPEQRVKLAERFKQREQRMKDHLQRRAGGASAPAR
jgi:periplasmic protein CpxP/Spy